MVIILFLRVIVIINSVFYVPHKYTIHAEKMCIMNCKNKKIISKCIMVLFRIIKINNKYEFIDCQSCHMCQKLVKKMGIKKVYYYN
jgi:deoxycytidylate deaminase